MVVLLWIVCGVIAGSIGGKKGQGCVGFVAGLLLGPIGILLMIFTQGNRRLCAYCREAMHRDATICPHCQRKQPANPETRPK